MFDLHFLDGDGGGGGGSDCGGGEDVMTRNTSTFFLEQKTQKSKVAWVFHLCFQFASILFACLS